jgi:hypothetical protein
MVYFNQFKGIYSTKASATAVFTGIPMFPGAHLRPSIKTSQKARNFCKYQKQNSEFALRISHFSQRIMNLAEATAALSKKEGEKTQALEEMQKFEVAVCQTTRTSVLQRDLNDFLFPPLFRL